MLVKLVLLLILIGICNCCEKNEASVSFHRHYGSYPNEEYVNVYETGHSYTPLLIMTYKEVKDVTETKCLKLKTEYKISLSDIGMNGWGKDSYLKVTCGKKVLFEKLRLDSGSNYITSFTINSVDTDTGKGDDTDTGKDSESKNKWVLYVVIGVVAIVLLVLCLICCGCC